MRVIDQTLQDLMLASMKMLIEANNHGRSSIELEFDPAKTLGLDTDGGKFMVVIACGDELHKLKAALGRVA